MEGSGSDVLGDSLLRWVKFFEHVGRNNGWRELSDGHALWSILQDVDPDYFSGSLPEPDVEPADDWTRRWQNLKHVDKKVSTYYRDVCNGHEQLGTAYAPDLKAIAAEASATDVQKLIMIMIRAAMASPESNQRMAQRLMSLGRETAMVIAGELRAMEETQHVESEPASRDESASQSEQEAPEGLKTNGTKGSAVYRDPLLEREEELLQAQAIIDKLQTNHDAAQRQLQELRQDKDRLQEAFDAYRDEIDRHGPKTGADDTFKKLQRQAENDRAYIDDLEAQLQSSKSAAETYERQLQRHKEDQEASQKLRDDLQMLRTENEDLNQKVKANENLKKKLQTLQDVEKTNSTLRDELKDANERAQDFDRMKQLQASLEKEILEKRGLIRNQEHQINELTTTRKHAEYDARVLAQKLEAARERHDRDHAAIEDLSEKLQDYSNADAESKPQELSNELEALEREVKAPAATNDESKHLAEKLALVQQQLETADTRLKSANERSALLEEQRRNAEADADDQRKAQERIAQQDGTIGDLRKQLEAASKQQKDVPSHDMAALQRENHLMATAWYDLAGRLQNNGVSLGRRRQEPKSWIGKQRALVGPNAGLVSFHSISKYRIY